MPDARANIEVDQDESSEDIDDGMGIGFLGSMQPCDGDKVLLRLP